MSSGVLGVESGGAFSGHAGDPPSLPTEAQRRSPPSGSSVFHHSDTIPHYIAFLLIMITFCISCFNRVTIVGGPESQWKAQYLIFEKLREEVNSVF